MTVKELKAILANLPDDCPVHIGYDYGDHCHTQVTPGANSACLQDVCYSSYHQMDALADADDYDTDEDEESPQNPPREVLVIS